MSKSIQDLLFHLHRNFPDGCTTFGPCPNNCGNMGRGSGRCASCLTKELGELIDDEGLAFDYLDAIEKAHKLRCEITDKDWERREKSGDPAGVLR